MKKLFLLLLTSIQFICLNAQQWAYDEAVEDANETDPINILTIVYAGIFAMVIFASYKISKRLQDLSVPQYKKVAKISIISFITISSIIIGSIFVYHNYKYSCAKEDAQKAFINICNNNDAYFSLEYEKSFISCKEISVTDFYTQGNQLHNYWSDIIGLNNSGQGGVYFCYEISSAPMLAIAFGREVNKKLGEASSPSLYNCYIKPYRIRYFTQNPNPNHDVLIAYEDFRNKLLSNMKVRRTDDILAETSSMLNNEYFCIQPIIGGDEPWTNNRIMYECEIVTERVYEFQCVNYGDFEIMYGVCRPSKFGITEKLVKTPDNNFPNVSDYRLKRAITQAVRPLIILFILMSITFLVGYFKREQVP